MKINVIPELKLRNVTKLEEIKIRGENKKLKKERNRLLTSKRKLSNLLKKEIKWMLALIAPPERLSS
ncbi:MAG: hypothetical protein FKGGLIKP_00452 [Sodalis sp. Fse]|nr:MAG: hypothetical protein FKGGLIKP_00452 [Sodalis sp. Fse]